MVQPPDPFAATSSHAVVCPETAYESLNDTPSTDPEIVTDPEYDVWLTGAAIATVAVTLPPPANDDDDNPARPNTPAVDEDTATDNPDTEIPASRSEIVNPTSLVVPIVTDPNATAPADSNWPTSLTTTELPTANDTTGETTATDGNDEPEASYTGVDAATPPADDNPNALTIVDDDEYPDGPLGFTDTSATGASTATLPTPA